MLEKRKTPRQRVKEWGKVLTGRSVLNCTIVDVSASGAQLKIGVGHVPDVFFLFSKSSKRLRQAMVKWRGTNAVGVELSEPLDPGGEQARSLLEGAGLG